MDNSIRHSGKVVRVSPGEVDVVIETESACGSCRVKGICGMAESADKLLSVVTGDAAAFRAGEPVEVSVRRRLGMKAVLIAYVFPCIIVLTLLLGLLQAGSGDLTAGLVSLGGLAVYYLILFFFRGHLSREVVFEIHKTDLY